MSTLQGTAHPSGKMIADPNGGGGSEQALEAEEEAASARDDLRQIANDASTMQNDANQIDTDLDTSEMLSQYLGDGQGKAQEYLDDGLNLQQQYLAAANNARDDFIDYVNTLRDVGKWEMEYGGGLDEGISGTEYSRVLVVTAAWDPKTGKIWVGWKLTKTTWENGPNFCAEDDCAAQAQADGVSPSDIQFTMAIRPRLGTEKEICVYCQEDYNPDQVKISGAAPEEGGRWSQMDEQASADITGVGPSGEVVGEAEGFAEGLGDAMDDD